MASAMKSTCCSIDTTMFDSTLGLPGPVIMNRLGNPAATSPRYARGPSAHSSREAAAVTTAHVDAGERAGERVEAGREHEHVDVDVALLGADAGRRDLGDAALAEVDEGRRCRG